MRTTKGLWDALGKANRDKTPFVVYDEKERDFLVRRDNAWELPEVDFCKGWIRIGTVAFQDGEDLKIAIDAILEAHDSYGIALNENSSGIGIFVRCPTIAAPPLTEEEFFEGSDDGN